MSDQSGVCIIHKEELILLHMVLSRMKEVFEESGFTNEYFHSYDKLTIQPEMMKRSKADHLVDYHNIHFG